MTTVASDSFTRTTSSGWGTADTGGAWTVIEGASSIFSTSGGQGLITLPGDGTAGAVALESVSVADVDVSLGSITANFLPANVIGGDMNVYVSGRSDTSNRYRARLHAAHDGTVKISIEKVVSGAVTVIAAEVQLQAAGSVGTGYTYLNSDRWELKLSLSGTTVRARAWTSTNTEPSTWPVSVTDSSISAAGFVGVRAENTWDNASGSVFFDTFLANSTTSVSGSGYRATIEGQTPQNYWRFGDAAASTTAAADVGTLTGTRTGSAVFGAAGLLDGDADGAARFTNVSDGYITMADASLAFPGTAAFSITCLVSPSLVDGNTRQVVAAAVGSQDIYALRFNSSWTSLYRRNSAGLDDVQAATVLATGTRAHLAATYDGTTISVYVNGALVGTRASSRSIPSGTANLVVGREPQGFDPNQSMVGVIDELAVWTRALTATEVSAQVTVVTFTSGGGATVGDRRMLLGVGG